MNDDAATNRIPDELLAGWRDLPDEERQELARTWEMANQARDADPTPGALDEAERRLMSAIAGSTPGVHGFARASRRRHRIRMAAAAVLVIAAGVIFYLAQQPSGDAPSTAVTTREFMLLLHGEPLVRYPAEEHERIVGEYVAWARALGGDGRLVAGNELAPGGRILAVRSGAVREQEIERIEDAVSGYFIIAAADLDEAARIAADCPHLKYDGTVEVRQIGTN